MHLGLTDSNSYPCPASLGIEWPIRENNRNSRHQTHRERPLIQQVDEVGVEVVHMVPCRSSWLADYLLAPRLHQTKVLARFLLLEHQSPNANLLGCTSSRHRLLHHRKCLQWKCICMEAYCHGCGCRCHLRSIPYHTALFVPTKQRVLWMVWQPMVKLEAFW